MGIKAVLSGLLFAGMMISGVAQAAVIDFHRAIPTSMTGGVNEVVRTISYSVDGFDVTFSGYDLFVSSCCFGTYGITTQGFGIYPISVKFDDAITANFVQITNAISGIYTEEIDHISATAFDLRGNVLSTEASGNFLNRVDGPGISSLLYAGLNNEGMTLADFTFEYTKVGAIPELGSLALLGLTLAGLAVLRHRQFS